MLVIRLRRVGKKNQPAFKIIVTEKKKAPTKGIFIEEVGFWNPLTKERILKEERIKYWLSVGAKASDTIHNMLISGGVIKGEKIKKHSKLKKKGKEKKKGKGDEKKEESENQEKNKKGKPEEVIEEQSEIENKEEVKEKKEGSEKESKPEQIEEKKEIPETKE